MNKAGNYKGKHYTEWVDTVKSLKREDHLDEVIDLLTHLVDVVEAESRVEGLGVAPWYYEQLAIVHRKRKDIDAEVAILERYAAQAKAEGGGAANLAARLRAARDLQAAAAQRAQIAGEPPACPSCGSVLAAGPIKTATCPDCGQKIVVRRQQGQVLLLSEADDRERKKSAEISKFRERMLQRANRCGADDAEFERTSVELSARFGKEASPADVFWSIANRRSLEAASAGDWFTASGIYNEMAEHLVDENREWTDLGRQRVLAMLRGQAGWTASDAEMRIVGCDCSACAPEQGTVVTFSRAMDAPRLPHSDCAKAPCKCWYQEVRDLSQPVEIRVDVPVADAVAEVPRKGLLKRLFGAS